MSTYRIYFTTGASTSVKVEADDLESAIDEAFQEVPSGVCAQCAGWGDRPGIDIGDWDVDDSGHEVDGEYVTS